MIAATRQPVTQPIAIGRTNVRRRKTMQIGIDTFPVIPGIGENHGRCASRQHVAPLFEPVDTAITDHDQTVQAAGRKRIACTAVVVAAWAQFGRSGAAQRIAEIGGMHDRSQGGAAGQALPSQSAQREFPAEGIDKLIGQNAAVGGVGDREHPGRVGRGTDSRWQRAIITGRNRSQNAGLTHVEHDLGRGLGR